MANSLSSLQSGAPLPAGRQILIGVSNRFLLPLLAIALILWNLLFILNSWVLMPANDFGRMFHSALAFVDGRDMYAWTWATPVRLDEKNILDLYNMNPPHFHLLLLPLTLLKQDHALALWWVLSGLCFFHCFRWTLKETGVKLTEANRRWGLLLLLAFSGTTAVLATAQLSFILL